MRFFKGWCWLVLLVLVLISLSCWLVFGGKFFKKEDDLTKLPDFSFVDETGEIESIVLNKELLVENLSVFPPLEFWREFDGNKDLVYEIGFDEEVVIFGLKEKGEWVVGYSWSPESDRKKMKVFLKPSLVLGGQDFGRVEIICTG